MDTLRALAQQSSDPNCYLLAEQRIAEYLQNPGAALEKLSGAIDHEAETSQHYIAFWTTMQEFVSTLRPDRKELKSFCARARGPCKSGGHHHFTGAEDFP